MKKGLIILLSLLLFVTAVPVHALEKTGNSEYYLNLFRCEGEKYEGMAPIYTLLEDAGYDVDQSVNEQYRSIESSDEKILSISDGIATCNRAGDVNVTVNGEKGSKTYKVHVFDMKMNHVYRNSRKITMKAFGNLKGCKVIVRYAGKKYTRKITKKNQKITIKIPKAKLWKTVSVRLVKDKKELTGYSQKIFYAKRIKKGMSKSHAMKTLEYCRCGYNIKKKGKTEIWDCQDYMKVTLKNNRVIKVVRKKKIHF